MTPELARLVKAAVQDYQAGMPLSMCVEKAVLAAAALAERDREIERLEAELYVERGRDMPAVDAFVKAAEERDALRAQHAALVEALKEFANEDHWEQIGEKGNESDHWAWNDWRNPMDIAEAAVAQAEPEPTLPDFAKSAAKMLAKFDDEDRAAFNECIAQARGYSEHALTEARATIRLLQILVAEMKKAIQFQCLGGFCNVSKHVDALLADPAVLAALKEQP